MNVPDMMPAVLLHGPGEKQQYSHIPTPEAKPRQALVQVDYVGVNRVDLMVRDGTLKLSPTYPMITGVEGAGTIVALGDEVQNWRVGDRASIYPISDGDQVMGEHSPGLRRRYVAVHENQLVPVPTHLPLKSAACVPANFGTALRMLNGLLREGARVLIRGAAGGVGTALVQIARSKGAVVVATAGSQAKLDTLESLGADLTINHREEDVASVLRQTYNERRPIRLCIDYVGGDDFGSMLDTVENDGTIAIGGAAAGNLVTLNLRRVYSRRLRIIGRHLWSKEDQVEALRLARDSLKPLIHRSFALSDFGLAEEMLERREVIGKVVLDLTASS